MSNEMQRRRIRYHLSKRSNLEVELILRLFWESDSSYLTESELNAFEQILELEDLDFLEIFAGKKPLPEMYSLDLFLKIKSFWNQKRSSLF